MDDFDDVTCEEFYQAYYEDQDHSPLQVAVGDNLQDYELEDVPF